VEPPVPRLVADREGMIAFRRRAGALDVGVPVVLSLEQKSSQISMLPGESGTCHARFLPLRRESVFRRLPA
jgi:hypothetical protein